MMSFSKGSTAEASFGSGSRGKGGVRHRYSESNPFDAHFLEPDLRLLRAISKRFYEDCDKYFPPQVMEVARFFGEIGYSDE